MVDKTRINPTLLDHQNPEARWWAEVVSKLLPRLVSKLEQKFGDRHGISPEQAAQSAVRELLEPKQKNLCFESLDQMRPWLYTVAFHKLNDALKKERRLDYRVPIGDGCEGVESADDEAQLEAAADEAQQRLSTLRALLNAREQVVLDWKLSGKTYKQLAQEPGWTKTEVERFRKRIERKVKKYFEGKEQ